MRRNSQSRLSLYIGHGPHCGVNVNENEHIYSSPVLDLLTEQVLGPGVATCPREVALVSFYCSNNM